MRQRRNSLVTIAAISLAAYNSFILSTSGASLLSFSLACSHSELFMAGMVKIMRKGVICLVST